MAKEGMKQRVFKHQDPTFDAVLGKWMKEERAAQEEARAMMPIRVMGTVRALIARAGYDLISDIAIRDAEGNVYRSITEKPEKENAKNGEKRR